MLIGHGACKFEIIYLKNLRGFPYTTFMGVLNEKTHRLKVHTINCCPSKTIISRLARSDVLCIGEEAKKDAGGLVIFEEIVAVQIRAGGGA